MVRPRRKKPPIAKVLIANRGEIACRIIGTCHRMGIATVAVYAEADANTLHVQLADEAVLVGPPSAAESYLNIPAIIQAARQTGAQAIHPGYGFLSENSVFVNACGDAGITFIGPSSEVMDRMGDKIQARIIAAEAGLPLIPGTEAEVSDRDALTFAEEIGYPIMVKAAQGGGGIGIRVVATPEELPKALERARSLAQSNFGSSKVYLEKYLDGPSHIEVQVLADHFGNAVHLFERDCSVQRRNQKVVEESPTNKLKKRRRQRLYDAALALVSHIGYTNAGTIEFLVDSQGHFYFVEMNTRLQVEHPVTEMITGLDIVEQQIRISAGEHLSFSQKDIRRKGHAIEARIYPEDPGTFMPMSGRIETVEQPQMPHLRIDGALYPGYEISPFYDSLMAKVIAWGKSREKAVETLSEGLGKLKLEGITHNIPLIQQVLADEEFLTGSYSTLLLSQISERGRTGISEESDRDTVAAVTAALGSLFGGTPGPQAPSQWRSYGRLTQMTRRPGHGGHW